VSLNIHLRADLFPGEEQGQEDAAQEDPDDNQKGLICGDVPEAFHEHLDPDKDQDCGKAVMQVTASLKPTSWI